MSQTDDIKTNAREIHKGLKRLAPTTRVAALPAHTVRELLAELEEKSARLVAQLEELN